MNITESQNYNLLKHLLQGNRISVLTAMKKFGISSLHRRLYDLRSGEYDGIAWPISYGEWVQHNSKRYKFYEMDLEEVAKRITGDDSL